MWAINLCHRMSSNISNKFFLSTFWKCFPQRSSCIRIHEIKHSLIAFALRFEKYSFPLVFSEHQTSTAWYHFMLYRCHLWGLSSLSWTIKTTYVSFLRKCSIDTALIYRTSCNEVYKSKVNFIIQVKEAVYIDIVRHERNSQKILLCGMRRDIDDMIVVSPFFKPLITFSL